jgi:hypothetical protein
MQRGRETKCETDCYKETEFDKKLYFKIEILSEREKV